MLDLILFASVFAVYLLGGVTLGWYVGDRSRKIAAPLALIGLALTVFRTYLSYRPEMETAIFPFASYIYFSTWNTFTGAFLIVVVAKLSRGAWAKVRIGALGLTGLLGVMQCYLPFCVTADIRDMNNRVNPEGLVNQTTGYSCSPAATATLLRAIGIETTEREIARLSLTRPIFGTTLLGTYRALKIKAGEYGFKVKIVRCDRSRLKNLRKPLLLYTKFGYPHMNVLFAQSGDKLLVAEPERSFEKWNMDALDEHWSGIAIVIYLKSVEEEPSFFFNPQKWRRLAHSSYFRQFYIDHLRRLQNLLSDADTAWP